MDVIYTLGGGSWLQQLLNGVATFTQSSDFGRLVSIGTTLSVVVTAIAYIGKKDLMLFVKWAAYLVLITGILLGIKRPVQVIDLSEPSQVYEVDNVPLGIAMPFSLITGVGYGLTQAYEMVFTNPDAMTYSRTGMLFGASLVNASTDFASTNPQVAGLFSDYVQNCVVGDILLNHKYSMNELMNTPDPYSLIFSKPSPLRGVFTEDGTFETCQSAAAELQKYIVTDSSAGGGSWEYYVRHLMGGRPNASALFGQLMGDSYSYFYNSGQTASDIMKRNVTINALRHGISSYATRSGDTASLLNLSTETSFEKLRLSQSTSAKIATEQLPLMHTIVMGMLIGLFPVVIVMALAGTMPWNILRSYILLLVSLQMWPVLFAVLNSSINNLLRVDLGDMAPTLSNLSLTQQKYSDLAGLAGYAAMSIPPLAYFLAFSMEKGVLSMLGGMASAIQGPASAASSQAADGHWSINSMQSDNVQGHKWDTNSNVADGQMTSQLQNGAAATQTAGGGTVYNTGGAMSKLPMDMNFAKTLGSNAQRIDRESVAQAQNQLSGYNHATNSAYNQIKQFTAQSGNSSTLTKGADNSTSSSATEGYGLQVSAAKAYAQKNHISETEAFSELRDKSRRGELSGSLTGKAGIDSSKSLGGKAVEWATGASLGVEFRGGISGSLSNSSADNTQNRSSNDNSHSFDQNSQELKDFKRGEDMVKTARTSESGSHADNASNSKLEQISTTLAEADSHYQQYTDSMTRSKEYSKIASESETMSAQTQSNYAQEFVGYVQNKAPDRAEAILTDTVSPEVRAEREQLAGQFVEEKLRSRVEGHFETSLAQLGAGMEAVGNTAAPNGADAYQRGDAEIQAHAADAAVRTDTSGRVDSMVSDTNQRISNSDMEINTAKNGINSERSGLSAAHQMAESKFNTENAKAVENQRLPWVKGQDKMTQQALDMHNKYKGSGDDESK